MTLANVIRWNTDVTGLQDNVFFDKSVLIFEAPEAGANVSLVAADGTVTLIDTQTGQVLDRESLSTRLAGDPGRLGRRPATCSTCSSPAPTAGSRTASWCTAAGRAAT